MSPPAVLVFSALCCNQLRSAQVEALPYHIGSSIASMGHNTTICLSKINAN
jgi:hypothetical protein